MKTEEGIPFLIFEYGGQCFGVAVEQIEALTGLPQSAPPGASTTYTYQGEAVRARALSDWVGLAGAGHEASRMLIARSHDTVRAFLVDMPRDIVTLPVESIHRLPVLIQRALGTSPFWGIGHDRHNDALILLVDVDAACHTDTGRDMDESKGEGE